MDPSGGTIATEPPSALIANRYRLGAVLGRGGMGEVRAGHDLRLDRAVAVKLFRADMGSDPSIRARFEAEARSAASLVHPNVVLVLDTGEDSGVAFIVMERLGGQSLADALRASRLPADAVGDVATQVLAALGAAHRAGIIHRDIKPSNILAGAYGPNNLPIAWKVADFGIAKSLEGARSDLTSTGMLLGTPAYLAPERLAGQPATVASDVYSVGVVLYEALAGRRPFDADSPLALASLVANSEPEPLRQIRPDVSPAMVAVIERAMAKDATKRYPSAAAMGEAVTAAGPAGRKRREPRPDSAARPEEDHPTVVQIDNGDHRSLDLTPTGLRHAETLAAAATRGNVAADEAQTAVVGAVPATQVLSSAASAKGNAAGAPEQRAANGFERWRWAVAVAAIGVVLIVLLALSIAGGHNTASPTTSPPTTASAPATGGGANPLPPQLDRALRNLEHQVLP